MATSGSRQRASSASPKIPVILCDEWTPAQVKAFRLMVNRSVTWADWDEDLLALELQEIQESDFDLSLTGFDDQELARLLAAQDAAEGLTDEDAVPELPETPVSVIGDLWILGNHKLLVGDATDPNCCREADGWRYGGSRFHGSALQR